MINNEINKMRFILIHLRSFLTCSNVTRQDRGDNMETQSV